jgi:N-acetylglucosaminyl-diphospho-decaprenol L-rhamnosyltransferase
MSIDIVIPVLNQLHYTKQCLRDLFANTGSKFNIIVVNNGSTDGTAEYLESINFLTTINNDTNRGVAAAWNQGVKAGKSDRVVILNNDVLLPKGWLEGLLAYTEETGTDIVSPGMRGRACDYDFENYAADFMKAMSKTFRKGEAHGVCFMVRRAVFEKIGYFDENFRIGQYEDADFFLRAKLAGFTMAITGRSFIHHYGSVTQNALGNDKTTRPYEAENRAYFRQKWRIVWAKRLALRQQLKLKTFAWRLSEKLFHGYSLY